MCIGLRSDDASEAIDMAVELKVIPRGVAPRTSQPAPFPSVTDCPMSEDQHARLA